MTEPAENRPEYNWLREFKRIYGVEMQQRHGAHSLGIGWKRVRGKKTDELAMVFYVERKTKAAKLDYELVPPTLEFTPSGSDNAVALKTDVIESPAAKFE